MGSDGIFILEQLHAVDAERQRRRDDPLLQARADATKRYQQARFANTYADLLSQPRFAAATRFFLNDLYGPNDFSARDAQFARIVPALVRMFPAEIVATVRHLAELHALSETLDTRLAAALPGPGVTAADYSAAWPAAGGPDLRERQIGLMLSVGNALERYTARLVLRQSLRLMRGPARAAGMGGLQAFLEKGFDTFRDMGGGAQEFLHTIATRERALAAALFSADAMAADDRQAALRLLPAGPLP